MRAATCGAPILAYDGYPEVWPGFASITYQIGVGVRYAITMGHVTDLFKSTADAAFAVDDERFICGWNDAAERLLDILRPKFTRSCVPRFYEGIPFLVLASAALNSR